MGVKLHQGHGPPRTGYMFRCPGCHAAHVVYVEGPHPVWTWNGSLEAPTFRPSLRYTVAGSPEDDIPPERCHSFIRDGTIEFLSDCTHELRGQTVEIPDWENARWSGDPA